MADRNAVAGRVVTSAFTTSDDDDGDDDVEMMWTRTCGRHNNNKIINNQCRCKMLIATMCKIEQPLSKYLF